MAKRQKQGTMGKGFGLSLMDRIQNEGKIYRVGRTKAGRWYPGAGTGIASEKPNASNEKSNSES